MRLLSPQETPVEQTVIAAVDWLRMGIETFGAVVIVIGLAAAAFTFVRRLGGPAAGTAHHARLQGARRILAHYLAVALEFQLAADILATAIAPSWDQIGKLAAIAAIRTALNYFLSREMAGENP